MASPVVSANARMLQEVEIEVGLASRVLRALSDTLSSCFVQRLVKCRLRSEIEARKALESTMKRAVQEAREVKKELVLLRQENEELRKLKTSPSTTSLDESVLAAHKAAVKKLQHQIDKLDAERAAGDQRAQGLEDELAELQCERDDLTQQLKAALSAHERERVALEGELKKVHSTMDETKRKYQKLIREKKEEVQRALQENEQLAKCTETLQRQLELLPQLKKQLQNAKDRMSGSSDDWQKKLDAREQAFLSQAQDNKQQLEEKEREIERLQRITEELQDHVNAVESRAQEIEESYTAKLEREGDRLQELISLTTRLQSKLDTALDAAKDAERAKASAEETMKQEIYLRETAQDAADAVEARAEKLDQQLETACRQLEQVEKALKTRGITFDYLLKHERSSNNNKEPRPETTSRTRSTKGSSPSAARTSSLTAPRKAIPSARPAAVVKTPASATLQKKRTTTITSRSPGNNNLKEDTSERTRSR